jgi:hypothetical protein
MKRISLSILISILISTPIASAADCTVKACIEVYTQDGHLVIEGRKGSGAASSKANPSPIKSKKPSTPLAKPRPRILRSSKPIPRVQKPRVRKSATTSTSAATSLADKLIESLPTAGIAYQPSFSPLVQTPVFFWSDLPTVVTKRIKIVGEMVDVRLRPTYIWHYGDGVIYLTNKVGGPYPDGEIRHTYSKPGRYLIELITRWDGEFTVDGVTAHIPGEITTVSVLPITVVAAPIRFLN